MLDRAGVLDRVRRRVWGLSGRLIASYILVTLVVVAGVEVLVLCSQIAPLLIGNQLQVQLQAQVDATAKAYAQRLAAQYPGGVPAGTVLGDASTGSATGIGTGTGQSAKGGAGGSAPSGALAVPTYAGPIPGDQAVTAVVAIAADGTVVASSAPSRYPAGRPAASELPVQASSADVPNGRGGIKSGSVPTAYGNVLFWVAPSPGRGGDAAPPAGPRRRPVAYVYVQAPWSPPGFVGPVTALRDVAQAGEVGPVLLAPSVLLLAIVPVGVLFGLLSSGRVVRRVRRLERATLLVADGDYTVVLPVSGRDEVGRLEANFTAMTRQLDSALDAERLRAADDARAAEQARIAREMHDAISQHLFALRMIAAGMRRASPGDRQAEAIERISEEAVRDMQALLIELRPASLNGAGLAPALEEICTAYRERLGVAVDASLDDVSVPAPVEHALLRITQEACANAVRHGHARRLAISVTRQDGHVELAVRDTGAGFDPAAPHSGAGLANVQNRVAELGGTLVIASAPGSGAAITVRVPVP